MDLALILFRLVKESILSFDDPASVNKHAGVSITTGELANPTCWNKYAGAPKNLGIQPGGISEVSSTSLYLIRISSPFSGSIFPTYQLDHLILQVFQLCASTPASIVSDSSIAKSSPKTAILTPLG